MLAFPIGEDKLWQQSKLIIRKKKFSNDEDLHSQK